VAGYVGVSNSLEFDNGTFYNTNWRCPMYGTLNLDINGNIRMANTTKGAYERPPDPNYYDLAAMQLYQITGTEVVDNQSVLLEVDVWNAGYVTADSITFGYSVDGTVYPSVTTVLSQPLTAAQRRIVPVDVFTVTGNIGDTINIEVWIENINDIPDTLPENNTTSGYYVIVPLAEFAEPFVEDTISSLSFDVNVKIFEKTGATNPAPTMYIETFMDGVCATHNYDSVTMVLNGDKWVAHIPKQYYGAKVVYWTHIADSVGNYVDLKDSVLIQFSGGGNFTSIDFPYTGSVYQLDLSKGTYIVETWGANGGNSNGGILEIGGTGGYSTGILTVLSKSTYYVYVGGAGLMKTASIAANGGYNGGGNSPASPSGVQIGGSGGGATHIAAVSGLLNTLSAGNPNIKIVAGGGGGSGYVGGVTKFN
jgi:hypothetical protein